MTILSERRDAVLLGASVALSMLGLLLHNTREFGVRALLDPSTGTVPYGLLQVSLFALWLLVPRAQGFSEIALSLTAALQLVGGGVISVLPLSFLPFAPEQSVSHYLSHLILGALQLPLLIYPWVLRARRKAASAR